MKQQAKAVAVVPKQETAVATAKPEVQTFEQSSASDILIPKVLLMQALSDFVSEGKAANGDIVNSITGKVLGNKDKPLEFIPLTFFNSWINSEKIGNKFEYRGMEPRTPKNDDLPWEYEKDGTTWKRVKAINVYALLASDVEAEMKDLEEASKSNTMPDPDKAVLPVLISFRSTSLKAGQRITTHFEKVKNYAERGFNVQPYVSTFKLGCHRETNDLGTFFIFDVMEGGKTKAEFLKSAEYWRNMIVKGKTKIDESDEIKASAEVVVDSDVQY
jgi:hypothetical protein